MTLRRCANDLRQPDTRTPHRRMLIPTASVSISMTPKATTGSLFSICPVIRLNATITNCRIDNALQSENSIAQMFVSVNPKLENSLLLDSPRAFSIALKYPGRTELRIPVEADAIHREKTILPEGYSLQLIPEIYFRNLIFKTGDCSAWPLAFVLRSCARSITLLRR